MTPPLVSVICLCYNHEKYVEEAIKSVYDQTYPNIELIIVDDHSTDNSGMVILESISDRIKTQVISLPENLGNCRAFNIGLQKASGVYIIDHSADDVLMPLRIEFGVKAFNESDTEAGVNFGDAQLIDGEGKLLGYHSDRFPHDSVSQGDVYAELLSRYFISSPTTMMRREVFDKLVGYDESLAYEDFDFQLRASRYFKFIYTPKPLVKRRVLPSSLGKSQYKRGSTQLQSTLKVCEKAIALNRNSTEDSVLRKRMLYEARRAVMLGELALAMKYLRLRSKVGR